MQVRRMGSVKASAEIEWLDGSSCVEGIEDQP